MSTEDNPNEQQKIKRRGPDLRFVWGLVAVIIILGIALFIYLGSQKNSDQDNSEIVNNNQVNANDNQKIDNPITLPLIEDYKKSPGERFTFSVKYDKKDSSKSVDFAFRWAPAGTFVMGSPESEKGRRPNEKQHQVILTKGFWMLETEVTVGMFEAFVKDSGYKGGYTTPQDGGAYRYVPNEGVTPKDPYLFWNNPGFPQNSNHPVTCVDWNEANDFCEWLSKKTGLNILLPTEAQWEYACRAGTAEPWAGELSEMVWNLNYCTNQPFMEDDGKVIVGTKEVRMNKPNKWGLYDMHGNVFEWCQDWYSDNFEGSVTDPSGQQGDGTTKIYRGGCWMYPGEEIMRSAYRDSATPKWKAYNLGFRIVLIP